jgi:hypothetical protein
MDTFGPPPLMRRDSKLASAAQQAHQLQLAQQQEQLARIEGMLAGLTAALHPQQSTAAPIASEPSKEADKQLDKQLGAPTLAPIGTTVLRVTASPEARRDDAGARGTHDDERAERRPSGTGTPQRRSLTRQRSAHFDPEAASADGRQRTRSADKDYSRPLVRSDSSLSTRSSQGSSSRRELSRELSTRSADEIRAAEVRAATRDYLRRKASRSDVQRVAQRVSTSRCRMPLLDPWTSPRVAAWDALITAILLYTIIELPLRVAFADQMYSHDALTVARWVELLSDVALMLDVVLNFIRGPRPANELGT